MTPPVQWRHTCHSLSRSTPTWAAPSPFHVDLGTPLDTDNPDNPRDTSGIDPDDPNHTWWFDAEGGEFTVGSSLILSTRPEDVAGWIVDQAARTDLPSTFSAGPIARARAARAGVDLKADTTAAVNPITTPPLEG